MPKHYDEMEEKKESGLQAEKIRGYKNKGMSERDATIKALVSMKREPSENTPTPATSSPSEEEYPYGLRIRLENDDLEKLGIANLPDVGTSMKIHADATVQSVSSNQTKGDEGSKKCVELQITGMQIKGSHSSAEESDDEEYEEEV